MLGVFPLLIPGGDLSRVATFTAYTQRLSSSPVTGQTPMLFDIIYFTIVALIFAIPVVLAISAFGGVAIGSARPYWFVMAYWLLVFYFPNASFGFDFRTVDLRGNIYVRGAGLLFIPAVNVALVGLAILCAISRYFKTVAPVRHNLGLVFWGWVALYAANVIYGLASGFEAKDLVSEKGLFNILNLILAFYITTHFVRDAQDVRNMLNIFLFAAVSRGIFGVGRFLFAGGDPANAYANIEKLAIKLTFFDINDVLIATLAAFIAGWRFMALRHDKLSWQKAMYLGILAMESFIVLFSFRRTGWVGFGLVAILFAMVFQGRTRLRLFGLYLLVGIPALASQGVKRMVETVRTSNANFLERLAPDIFLTRSSASETPSRWIEWSAAWDAIMSSPLVGLGLKGEYNGYGYRQLAFHNFDFTWLHSGFLHIGLKAGLVGWILLFGMWGLFLHFVIKHFKEGSKDVRLLMLLGVATLLFYMPTWLLGSPTIEYRTMQLHGFAMALPYLAYALSRRTERT